MIFCGLLQPHLITLELRDRLGELTCRLEFG